MRQIYIKDIIKTAPIIGGGILEIIDLQPYCAVCNMALSFTRDKDDRMILNVGDCHCTEPSQGTIAEKTNYRILRNGQDVSAVVELRNGKANPFGWSQFEVWHGNKRIGFLESGALDITDDPFKEYVIEEKKPEANRA